MEIGMIGLGRVGGNMVQRLLSGGHRVVTYDRSADAVTASQPRALWARPPSRIWWASCPNLVPYG